MSRQSFYRYVHNLFELIGNLTTYFANILLYLRLPKNILPLLMTYLYEKNL